MQAACELLVFGREAASGSALSHPEIAPNSVRAAQLVRHETGLIRHGPTALDVIAEVDVRQLPARCFFHQAKYVPGAQRTAALLGIVKEIDRRQSSRRFARAFGRPW